MTALLAFTLARLRPRRPVLSHRTKSHVRTIHRPYDQERT